METEKCDDPHQEVVQIVKNFGYPIEVYLDIETEDGYLLTLYRVPHGKNLDENSPKRPVVFIMHGFLSSSLDYLLLGPKRALGYALADEGYDVWLGNYRGSKYARKHTKLDPLNDKEYWNFSFHEIGVYDLPAMIDFILGKTGSKQVSYIGISQGTTSALVLLSEKPHYNQVFKVFICLAPIVCVGHSPGVLIRTLAKYPVTWKPIAIGLGWSSFPNEFLINVGRRVINSSGPQGLVTSILIKILFVLFGDNYQQLDREHFGIIANNILNATSVKHYIHFSQNAIAGKLQKFDFGSVENLKRYQQETPLVYDLSKVTCPVAVFHSIGDRISGQEHVDILKASLSNVVVDHVIEDKNFNHMDFAFALDAYGLLYVHVRKTLDEYNKK